MEVSLTQIQAYYQTKSIWNASLRGDLPAIQKYLDQGVPVDAEAPPGRDEGCTALQLAARAGRAAVVQLLISAGAEVDKAASSAPALHLAAFLPNIQIVQQLLEAGADVNRAAGTGETPLMKAAAAPQGSVYDDIAESDKLAVVQRLLDAGAAVNLADNTGCTALHHAADSGSLEVIKQLLAAGADACATDSEGRSPMVLAAVNGSLCIVDALLELVAMPVPVLVAAGKSIAASVDERGLRSAHQVAVIKVADKIAELDRDAAIGMVKELPLTNSKADAFQRGWLGGVDFASATSAQERAAFEQERQEVAEQRQGLQQLIIGLAAMHKKQAVRPTKASVTAE